MYTWLVSYVSVLMIPVFISIMTYLSAEKVVRNQAVEYNKVLMESVMDKIDFFLAENIKITEFVASNSKITDALKISKPLTKEHYYTLYELSKEISNYRSSFRLKNNFYIYLKSADVVILNSNVVDSNDYFADNYQSYLLNYEEWTKKMTDPKSSYIWVLNSDVGKRLLLYMNQFPIGTRFEKSGAVIIESKEMEISEIFGDRQDSINAEYAVFDGFSNLVLSSRKLSGLTYSEFNSLKSSILKYNGEKYIVKVEDSTETGFKYVTLVSYSQFWRGMNILRVISIILLLIGTFISLILAIYMTKRNYTPLQKVVDALSFNENSDAHQKDNEYEIIQSAFEIIQKENTDISTLLEKQNMQLRNSFLARLLKNPISERDAQIVEMLKVYEINFVSDYFSVLLFYIEDCTVLFEDNENISQEEQMKTVNYAIRNVSEEIVQTLGNVGYMTIADDVAALIVNFSIDNIKDAKSQLSYISKFIQNFFKEKFDVGLTVAVSNMHKTFSGLTIAYKEAITAAEYKLVLGEESIIKAEQLQERLEDGAYSYTFEQEQLLINYIKTGNYESAEILIDNIFYNSFKSTIMPLDLARCIAFDMVGTLLKLNDELYDPNGKEFFNTKALFERLFSWQTVDALKGAMLKIIKDFCENSAKRQNIRLKIMVEDYIKENYVDANLSVGAISDALKLHPSYVSATFKEQSGEGLLEHINRFRVEQAKVLTGSTHMNFDDIAQRVGYSNKKTLFRVFKKYEGITPAKYRESNII